LLKQKYNFSPAYPTNGPSITRRRFARIGPTDATVDERLGTGPVPIAQPQQGRRHRLLADMLPWELPPASKPAEHGDWALGIEGEEMAFGHFFIR